MDQTTNPPPELPSISGKVEELYPCVFAMNSKSSSGKVIKMVEIFANGRVDFHGNSSNDAAKMFWAQVSHLILTEGKEVQLLRDLTFLLTFIQSKGVFFSNPHEKIELAAWIGQMERRYNIGQN